MTSNIQAVLRTRLQSLWQRRALRITLASLVGLFLLFGLLGYFWLPGFAKGKLEALLSEQFLRPVSIERIDISPYTLSATVTGFQVGQGEGRLFAFDSLYVDVSGQSLFRALPVVNEVHLVGPSLHLVREAPGRYNISDLIEKWTEKPSEGPTPSFSVANVTVEGGRIEVDDKPLKAHHEVSELKLGIPFIANTPATVETYVEPHFSAKVNGAPVALEGKLRPFAPGKDAVLEVAVTDFDLARVDEYVPMALPVQLQAAKLDTKLEVTFAKPVDKAPALTVAGSVGLKGVELTKPAAGGKEAPVRLSLASAVLQFKDASLDGQLPLHASLVLTDAAMRRNGQKQELAGFAKLALEGVEVQLNKRHALVHKVSLEGPKATMQRGADGQLDLIAALAMPTGPAKAGVLAKAETEPGKTAMAKPEAAKAGPAPWSWHVSQVAVSGGSLRYSDASLDKAPPLNIAGLDVNLDGLDSAPKTLSKLAVKAKVNEQGHLDVAGQLGLAPVSADLALDVQQLNLVALQGWVADRLNAVLTKGDVSVKGKLQVAPAGVGFQGDVLLADFNVLDKVNAVDLLRWRSLKLAGVEAGSEPLRFAVDEIGLNQFYARAILSPEGKLNLKDVVKRPEEAHTTLVADGSKGTGKDGMKEGGKDGGKSAAQAAPAPAPASAQAAAAPGPRISIGKVTLSGGNVNFTDRFVKPNYNANLTNLEGSVGTLAAGKPAAVKVKGKVDRSAPLEVSGKVDPLGVPIFVDLQAKARGIDMSTFSPYSGRYVGYVIEKGKLSVDVAYHVEKGELKAENHVFLDQLTFGQKVESPDALSVPVNLVVALLKNSRGEIDINLPISGSLNDPEFSIGGIIVKVILNLFAKAVTSPFALIGSLFSGGEDLSYLAFESGRATLAPEMEKRLETMAKALNDRPALRLEISGHADPAKDKEGLKRAILERKVKSQKLAELAKGGKAAGSLAEVTLSPEEYPRYLEKAYKAEDFKKPRNVIGLTKSLPVADMEALMLEHIDAGDAEMQQLAQRRATRAQNWLVETGGVPLERVFLLAPTVNLDAPKGAPEGGRVDFSLK